MHALVIHESRPDRELLSGYLQQANYRVDVAADRAAAAAFLDAEPPDLVLLSWQQSAPDLVRSIRAREDLKHTYVIALLDKHGPTAIPAIMQAGADDFMRRPFVREE